MWIRSEILVWIFGIFIGYAIAGIVSQIPNSPPVSGLVRGQCYSMKGLENLQYKYGVHDVAGSFDARKRIVEYWQSDHNPSWMLLVVNKQEKKCVLAGYLTNAQ